MYGGIPFPLLEVLDAAEGVYVGGIVVDVAVGKCDKERLCELLGAGGVEPPSCRPLNSTPDKCIVLGSNECARNAPCTKPDDSSPRMTGFEEIVTQKFIFQCFAVQVG
jgi:hypothetical protein